MITSYDIIKNLVRPEKSIALEKQHKYLFKVASNATKVDIRRAVQEIYKVKVKDVNTLIIPGKLKRVRYKAGYKSDWKKAVVTLNEGQKIEVV